MLLFGFFFSSVIKLCRFCFSFKHVLVHMLTVWSPATAFMAFIACHSALTDIHKRVLPVCVCLSLFHSFSPSVSQTCSFCFSASLSLQRKPWPRFQTRLVAMAKIFSEYYGLSLNYTCCARVCFPFKEGFSLLRAVLGMESSICYWRIQTETSNAPLDMSSSIFTENGMCSEEELWLSEFGFL